MPSIPQIRIGNGTYDIKDSMARKALDNVSGTVKGLKNGSLHNSANASAVSTKYALPVPVGADKKVVVKANVELPQGCSYLWCLALYNDSGFETPDPAKELQYYDPLYTTKNAVVEIDLNRVSGVKGFGISLYISYENGTYYPLRVENFNYNCFDVIYTYQNIIMKNKIENSLNNACLYVGDFKNGSLHNSANASAVSTKYALQAPLVTDKKVVVKANVELPQGYSYHWCLALYNDIGFETPKLEAELKYYDPYCMTKSPVTEIDLNGANGVKGFGITLFLTDENGDHYPLRVENFTGNCFDIIYTYQNIVTDNKIEDLSDNTIVPLKNARRIGRNETTQPLTLLHFSDIHEDVNALARIKEKANKIKSDIDDMICTGDMVLNSASQIASWWDEDILTCIGNHDSASFDSSSTPQYDWTALSMSDRDSYYIAPFEQNWNINHTSGKSYYYKDYQASNVRLIVMDAMLYTDNGQDATNQTTWLSNLLSDAISNNLHVLIAIHAVHGGSRVIPCSFSQLGMDTYPVYTDCNTPQSVIDVVNEKIANGLHFAGYIVGHEHGDYICDASNNGTQLFYCVTCASTSQTQNGSDQYRGPEADAFNLITIDTVHTLVKIIRGGGAEMDKCMRTRKAICFNYSTGEKIGEVL